MKRETHIYFIFSAHVAALFALMILKNIKYFLHKAKIQCSVSCLFSLYQYITYIYDDDEPIHVQTKKILGCSKAIFMYSVHQAIQAKYYHMQISSCLLALIRVLHFSNIFAIYYLIFFTRFSFFDVREYFGYLFFMCFI